VIGISDKCSTRNRENLEESHARETRAIDFYKQAAKEAKNERVKEIFNALVQVETDHLHLSGERLEK
jgi:rubrerythrin